MGFRPLMASLGRRGGPGCRASYIAAQTAEAEFTVPLPRGTGPDVENLTVVGRGANAPHRNVA